MNRRAFTLMEILLVIAIIVLLVALLLPVFHQGRKKSYEPVCINNLRQFHVAFTMYREDYGDSPKYQAWLLPYIKDKRLLRCPMDTYKHGAGWWTADVPSRLFDTSYFYYRPLSDPFKEIMERLDPNHGIAACVLHGRRTRVELHAAEFDFIGRVLRLRLDGSVSPGYAELLCIKRPGSVYPAKQRHGWFLYTDIRPIPKEVLDTDPSLKDAEVYPCEE